MTTAAPTPHQAAWAKAIRAMWPHAKMSVEQVIELSGQTGELTAQQIGEIVRQHARTTQFPDVAGLLKVVSTYRNARSFDAKQADERQQRRLDAMRAEREQEQMRVDVQRWLSEASDADIERAKAALGHGFPRNVAALTREELKTRPATAMMLMRTGKGVQA